MDLSQEFDITNTYKTKTYITTTGISEIEKSIIKKIIPPHIILEDELTPLTSYLLSYKSIISDKFIQAMIWNIKFVKIDWIYDLENNTTKYYMKPLEGLEFSSLDITNDIFINYFILLGAHYNENLTISSAFLITDNVEDKKIDFCKKHDIPIIRTKDVFRNNYKLIQKPFTLTALRNDVPDVFKNKTFYIDPNLDKQIFNALKKYILQGDGMRVSVVDENVDFIISNSLEMFKNSKNNILHYQYIFDCIEHQSELIPNSYLIHPVKNDNVLKNCVISIDPQIRNQILINKLKALGSTIKDEEDITCTHLIIKDKNDYKLTRSKPYKVVSSEWIDQCLYTMRHEKEDKYLVRESNLNLFSNPIEKNRLKRIKANIPSEIIFQFTGLPTPLKLKAIEMFEKYNIKYIDSSKYENCTHLIMGSITTSEKFLSALCNGAWILTPAFIDEFDNSLHFDYSKYEWKCDEHTCKKDIKIINSIKKWRERVAKTGLKALYKWKVKIYAEEDKKANYKRIIENGGGIVVEDGCATHVFVSKTYTGPINETKTYPTDYIFLYLFR